MSVNSDRRKKSVDEVYNFTLGGESPSNSILSSPSRFDHSDSVYMDDVLSQPEIKRRRVDGDSASQSQSPLAFEDAYNSVDDTSLSTTAERATGMASATMGHAATHNNATTNMLVPAPLSLSSSMSSQRTKEAQLHSSTSNVSTLSRTNNCETNGASGGGGGGGGGGEDLDKKRMLEHLMCNFSSGELLNAMLSAK